MDTFVVYLTIEISFDGKVSTDEFDKAWADLIRATPRIGNLALSDVDYILRAITGLYYILFVVIFVAGIF